MESTGDRLDAVKDPQIAELGRRGQAAAAAAAVTHSRSPSRSALSPRTQSGALSLTLFEHADRLGVYTVEPGASGALTVLELEVATWLCSRWRELDDPKAQRVPMALAQVAADFGWNTSGANIRRLALALDRLTESRARRRFHLLESWQAGRPDSPGRQRDLRLGAARVVAS